jgi:diacylglycerol kinase family enzyme
MQVILVHNPASGSAMNLKDLKAHFKKAGINVATTLDITKDEGKLRKLTAKDIVAGYGGDGTLNSIASALIESGAAFAPLAGGTLNHFTKDLGVPQDLDAALAALKQAKPRMIDVACINDRIFLNNSSIGLYPATLKMRDEQEQQSTNKWVAAVIASFKAFVRYRSYVVAIDGETFRTPFVFVGNNDYKLEDRLIGGRTRLDQGKLSVYAVAAASRWSLFRVLLRALFGSISSLEEVKLWKTKQLTIQTRAKRIAISRDGEHESVTTPLTYKILAGKLKIIAGHEDA